MDVILGVIFVLSGNNENQLNEISIMIQTRN